jgi:hypothetical protein
MAGPFDNLFAAFSTQPQQNAANIQTGAAQRGFDTVAQNYGLGQGALTSNFGQGADALRTSYAAGLSPLLANYAASSGGANAYGNATGANGAAGYADAFKNFQTSPGFQQAIDIGSQNVMRNQAATGQLASGKTNLDLQSFAQNMQNQQWQNYIQNLLPFLGQQTTTGGQIAGMDAGLGGQLNANSMGLGTGLNQGFQGVGNAGYGAYTSAGNANANAALAPLTASGNMLNFGMNAAKVASGTGGMGMGSDLFGGFTPPQNTTNNYSGMGSWR